MRPLYARFLEDLFGRGGPDDLDWMLVPRTPRRPIQERLQRNLVPTESPEPIEL